MPATMRAVQITRAGGSFELVDRPVPEPAPGWVRVKVKACGICHSDSITKEGHLPNIQYPRVPGHEVVGVIDAVGRDVPPRWKRGSASASVGTRGTAACATTAAGATSSRARRGRR